MYPRRHTPGDTVTPGVIRSSQDVVVPPSSPRVTTGVTTVVTPVVIAATLAGGAEGAHLWVPPRRGARRRVVLGPHWHATP